jgi:hypothetical protein
MGIDHLQKLTDEELAAEFVHVASTTVSNVSSIQNEFQRRATLKLIDVISQISAQTRDLADATAHLRTAVEQVRGSSVRLEKLTARLLLLTILLLIAAAPPAIEVLAHAVKEMLR